MGNKHQNKHVAIPLQCEQGSVFHFTLCHIQLIQRKCDCDSVIMSHGSGCDSVTLQCGHHFDVSVTAVTVVIVLCYSDFVTESLYSLESVQCLCDKGILPLE